MDDPKALPAAEGMIAHGPIRVDLMTGYVEVDGSAVDLQPKQFYLLAYLIQRAGRAVASQELWASVFRNSRLQQGSHVRRQIMELRRRLGSAGRLIVTTPTGYALSDES